MKCTHLFDAYRGSTNDAKGYTYLFEEEKLNQPQKSESFWARIEKETNGFGITNKRVCEIGSCRI